MVGFPGETDEDFEYLLDWLTKARLDRVGCFTYSEIEGAVANDLPNPVPESVKQSRYERLMALQQKSVPKNLPKKLVRHWLFWLMKLIQKKILPFAEAMLMHPKLMVMSMWTILMQQSKQVIC